MQNDIRNLIDDSNTDLWLEMSKKYDIYLIESFEPNYMINIRKRFLRKTRAKIYYQKHNICSASFTHELLHLKLRSKKIFINDDFFNGVKNNSVLHYLFSHRLKEHIGNCLEHVKMLPMFIEMGYNAEDFISDYSTKKMTEIELLRIQVTYREDKIYNRDTIDVFIGKFFAIKACNNLTFDYSNFLSLLEKVDENLFKVLNDFWNSWNNYDIENKTAYRNLLTKFFIDLTDWRKGKVIL